MAFIFNVVFILFGQILIHMPGLGFAAENDLAFNNLLSLSSRIVIASFVAYVISETANSYFVAKLQIKIIIELIGLPISIRLAKKLKKIE